METNIQFNSLTLIFIELINLLIFLLTLVSYILKYYTVFTIFIREHLLAPTFAMKFQFQR